MGGQSSFPALPAWVGVERVAVRAARRGEELCWALLWLNPGDHLGVAELLPKIIARQLWTRRR